MISNFEFEDEGRTFICSVETPRHAGMPPWWWFAVAPGSSTRYAPFEAKSTDTKQSVQRRVLKHYEEVLAIKARPAYTRPPWQKPARPPQAATATDSAVPAKA